MFRDLNGLDNSVYLLLKELYGWASLVAQMVKNPPAMWKTWVQSLGWKDPLEESLATHSSILAWRILWTVAHQAPLGILQSRIMEWVAMPSSRGSSRPRDQTQVSHIAGGFFTV